MTERAVFINWRLSSFFGWGVYGLNLALHWSADRDMSVVVSMPISDGDLALGPLRRRALQPLIERSREFQAKLRPYENRVATVQAPCLNSCDRRFLVSGVAHNVRLAGTPTIGVTFFETPQLDADAITRARACPVVVTGSTWNAELLRAHGLTNVRNVLQGIDPSLFHPAPRLGVYTDRFLIFSGGKLERRKGQDIVLTAVRRFVERHPDALLVTAWHGPVTDYIRTLDAGGLTSPVPFDGIGQVDVTGWALANGIGPDNVLDLGSVPNAMMPGLLREMDVALFPNRAEGGTNLVAMECMACGVPTILSANTGHLDLIEDENCYPLVQQNALPGEEAGFGGVAGWGESDVEEVLEQLERVYAHRAEALRRGRLGAVAMRQLTWARTAAQMKEIVLAA
ncbi:glycosyltransferase family 4 protein [Phenylobacterium sp.]|uniref:glycosyltransferase family 4 protein n=1 Tax=Phenylobacterium sp. TaxID=1871053 RepID=UPI00122234FF|nr:glycosyltransferase family 4 protein [Phenylobacterium sp.]THD59051.1 MAG: glycosyltransferase [Phenylobacterium sp.]